MVFCIVNEFADGRYITFIISWTFLAYAKSDCTSLEQQVRSPKGI